MAKIRIFLFCIMFFWGCYPPDWKIDPEYADKLMRPSSETRRKEGKHIYDSIDKLQIVVASPEDSGPRPFLLTLLIQSPFYLNQGTLSIFLSFLKL